MEAKAEAEQAEMAAEAERKRWCGGGGGGGTGWWERGQGWVGGVRRLDTLDPLFPYLGGRIAQLKPLGPATARKLFSAAFLSCWVELTADQQALLTEGLEKAMYHNQPFMQLMLSTAEFMSHCPPDVAAPISSEVLGQMGIECHAFAKALRYKEQEFAMHFDVHGLTCGKHPETVEPNPELLATVEDLIRIHQALGEPEAAQGVLAFLKTNMEQSADSVIPPSWYEKLGEWSNAFDAYEQKLSVDPQNFDLALGRMRCLDSLGKWQELHELVEGMLLAADRRGYADYVPA